MVAAVAIMNHISFIQRREEFGILNALGRSRLWLVLRTARETGSVVAIAWLISAVICGASLFYTQATVYAPKGISLKLYLLSGLRRATTGGVYLDDRAYGKMPERERVALRRSEFGFVFQQHFLINYLTALENVMVAAPVQGKAHAEQARALLADLGMGDKLHRFPYELSGGERQRVAVARAMIHRPRVIFADEPTGLLDRRTGLQVMALLRSYRDQGSLIAVTHNPEILAEADLVITLRDGQTTRVEDRLAHVAQADQSSERA